MSSSKTHSSKYSIHLAWALGYHWGNCFSDNASILYQILLALPILYPTMPRNSPEKLACYSVSSSGIQTRTLVCSQIVEVRANSVPFWMPSVTQGQLFLTQTSCGCLQPDLACLQFITRSQNVFSEFLPCNDM